MQPGKEVGQRPYVVFVAVRDDYRANLFGPLVDIAEIGDYEVDAEHFGVRKHNATVDHDRVALIFHNHGITPDFPNAAERYDSQRARFDAGCQFGYGFGRTKINRASKQ